jgi:hypothetical protein
VPFSTEFTNQPSAAAQSMLEGSGSEFFAWFSVRSTAATRTIFRDPCIPENNTSTKRYFAAPLKKRNRIPGFRIVSAGT